MLGKWEIIQKQSPTATVHHPVQGREARRMESSAKEFINQENQGQ